MTKKTQVYNSVAEYIAASNIWVNTPAVINAKGEMLFTIRGQTVGREEFLCANPKPTFEQMSGNDLNGESNGLLYGVRIRTKGR